MSHPDLEFLKRPSEWHNGYCCLIKEENGKRQHAFLDQSKPLTLNFGNIFAWDTSQIETKQYDSAESILKDGWAVD